MRFLFATIIFAFSFSSISAVAQQAQPDRWKGLVIDKSTPDDAIRILGQPASDKISRLFASGFDSKWLTKKISENKYRRLEFKKVLEVDRVFLSFLDGTLVSIDIDLAEESPAASLSRIYGIQFAPRISGLDEAFSPRDFERNQGRLYPKFYPTVYNLVAVSEKTFINGLVANSGFGSILKKSVGVTDTGDFPGKVAWVQILSRRVENFDGAGALSGDDPLSAESPKPAAVPEQKRTSAQPSPPTVEKPKTEPKTELKTEPKKKTCYEGGYKVPCP